MGAVKFGKQLGVTSVPGGRASVARRIAARLVLVLLAVAAAYSLLLLIATATTSFSGRPLDLSAYYAAAAALHADPHADIYDPAVLARAARAQPGCMLWPEAAYLYPPLLAIVLQPLAVLPFDAAMHVWLVFNLALWALATVLLVHWLRVLLSGDRGIATRGLSWRGQLVKLVRGETDWPTVAAAGVIAVSVLAWPVLQGLLLGQVHLLVMLLLLCIPLCLRRRWQILAGVLLALAIIIKLLPLVLLAYFLARGRWRLILSTVMTALLLLGAMLLVVGAPTLRHGLTVFGRVSHQSGFAENLGLPQVPIWVAAAFGGHASTETAALGRLFVVLTALIFGAGLVVIWRIRRAGGNRPHIAASDAADATELLGYGWAVCAMVLLSPLVWLHYYTWLLAPLVFCLGYLLRKWPVSSGLKRRRASGMLALLLVVGVLLFLPWLQGLNAASFEAGSRLAGVELLPLLMLLQPAAVALLSGIAGWLTWQSGWRDTAPATPAGIRE